MSGTRGFRFDSESLSFLEKALAKLGPGFEKLPAVERRGSAGLAAAVEAAAVKQREIGFERGIVRRVTARSA